jgi:hypothetical protein
VNLIEKLRNRYENYPSATIEIKNFEQGPPVIAPVEVRIFGDQHGYFAAVGGWCGGNAKRNQGYDLCKEPAEESEIGYKVRNQ